MEIGEMFNNADVGRGGLRTKYWNYSILSGQFAKCGEIDRGAGIQNRFFIEQVRNPPPEPYENPGQPIGRKIRNAGAHMLSAAACGEFPDWNPSPEAESRLSHAETTFQNPQTRRCRCRPVP